MNTEAIAIICQHTKCKTLSTAIRKMKFEINSSTKNLEDKNSSQAIILNNKNNHYNESNPYTIQELQENKAYGKCLVDLDNVLLSVFETHNKILGEEKYLLYSLKQSYKSQYGIEEFLKVQEQINIIGENKHNRNQNQNTSYRKEMKYLIKVTHLFFSFDFHIDSQNLNNQNLKNKISKIYNIKQKLDGRSLCTNNINVIKKLINDNKTDILEIIDELLIIPLDSVNNFISVKLKVLHSIKMKNKINNF
jgi:hypothetical protein